MKYWLVQINVGTIYFFLFSSDILFVFSPSWFWLVGQTFGTVNLKPFFIFFSFDVVPVLHRRAPRRHFRNTPPNSAAQLRHNGIPQKPFMSSATADRKCVETPTEDYFVILCIVCEHKQRVIHARLVTPLTAQSPSLFGSERERFITALFWL